MTDQYYDGYNGKVVTEEEIENWFDSEEEVEENIVHNVELNFCNLPKLCKVRFERALP